MLSRIVKINQLISSQENEQLRASLLQAQTNIAILHSELDKLKNMYTDQKAQHERWSAVVKSAFTKQHPAADRIIYFYRETDDLKRMVAEYQSYSSQIQILQ